MALAAVALMWMLGVGYVEVRQSAKEELQDVVPPSLFLGGSTQCKCQRFGPLFGVSLAECGGFSPWGGFYPDFPFNYLGRQLF